MHIINKKYIWKYYYMYFKAINSFGFLFNFNFIIVVTKHGNQSGLNVKYMIFNYNVILLNMKYTFKQEKFAWNFWNF